VYVWGSRLDEGWPRQACSLALLSADERARASRIRADRARDRFVASRATLRRGLGHVLDVDPARLRFAASSSGRPYLAWPPQAMGFSASRSGDITFGACAMDGRVGVDVEEIVERVDLPDLVRRHFHADEVAELAGASSISWTEAFYSIWTRKEAVLKALGCGVFEGLDEAEQPAAREIRARPWDLGAGYGAAIAVEADAWHAELIDVA
jgi:4'-phosphopantetheinyl transferase